jgi:hypothetical protein
MMPEPQLTPMKRLILEIMATYGPLRRDDAMEVTLHAIQHGTCACPTPDRQRLPSSGVPMCGTCHGLLDPAVE